MGAAAERFGHRRNALLAAFDLDEYADRRLVDGDGDILVRELLAVLLVAEPDVKAELVEHPQQDLTVADEGLVFLPDRQGRRLDRSLEGDPALAVLDTDAQHTAPAPQQLVFGVEQRVLLQ